MKPRKRIKIPLSKLTPRQRRQLQPTTERRNLTKHYSLNDINPNTGKVKSYGVEATIDGKAVWIKGRERRKLNPEMTELFRARRTVAAGGRGSIYYPQRAANTGGSNKTRKTKRKK